MGHPLRTYRKKAHITLEQLGAMVGVTKGFLSKIESGQQIPSLKIAAKISKATNGAVTPNDFLPQSENPAEASSPFQPDAAE